MQRYYVIVFVFISLSSCSIGRLTRIGVYEEVPASDFLTYLRDSTVNIIDVRTEAEFEKSHIHGARNASYFGGNFKEDVIELNLDKSKPTLIYCETQHRSLFVAKILYKQGFSTIIDLDKGMMHWRKKGFPHYVKVGE